MYRTHVLMRFQKVLVKQFLFLQRSLVQLNQPVDSQHFKLNVTHGLRSVTCTNNISVGSAGLFEQLS